jgi:hypothetical protein
MPPLFNPKRYGGTSGTRLVTAKENYFWLRPPKCCFQQLFGFGAGEDSWLGHDLTCKQACKSVSITFRNPGTSRLRTSSHRKIPLHKPTGLAHPPQLGWLPSHAEFPALRIAPGNSHPRHESCPVRARGASKKRPQTG